MLNRILAALVAVVLPVATASAADLAVRIEGEAAPKCDILKNIWIWGDPTNCPNQPVPACDSPKAVKAALASTARAEDVYRVPDVAEFTNPHELVNAYRNPSPLTRRYCAGHVLLTNGDRTTMYYFIEQDAGFVGIGWEVYTCILGHDRWRIYDGRCRVARPAQQFIRSEGILIE
jgi:hypothetical protein